MHKYAGKVTYPIGITISSSAVDFNNFLREHDGKTVYVTVALPEEEKLLQEAVHNLGKTELTHAWEGKTEVSWKDIKKLTGGEDT